MSKYPLKLGQENPLMTRLQSSEADLNSTSRLRKLIGNRVTERDIREQLKTAGFAGDVARFREVELHAIRRPGWKQLFRFECHVLNPSGDVVQLFGAVLDDERTQSEFWWSNDRAEQQEKLRGWSAGMIVCQPTPRHTVHWMLLAIFAGLVSLAVAGGLIKNYGGTAPTPKNEKSVQDSR